MKYLLAAGCSHTAGSEIDGTEDSEHNRQHSFAGILANKLDRKLINIASHGSSNSTIARSVLEWFSKNYKEGMDVFVVIGWAESARMEIPWNHDVGYGFNSRHWRGETEKKFLRINFGWEGGTDAEREVIPDLHRFMASNLIYLEILSAQLVLQLQYFFKSKNVDYVMSNMQHVFGDDRHLDFYLSQVDTSKYYNMRNSDKDFYWYYRNLGYENPNAKYWHHDDVPHMLYAEELYKFIKGQ